MISDIFAASARARRRWYTRRPYTRRGLARPVVSVGNLSLGGTGKTPTVAHLARRLVTWGERPAILTRGYGRVRPRDGVVVVREPDRVVGKLDESGDEPLMLALDTDGVAVLVSKDRYLAGCLAERTFDCTVHLLDDGFQHLALARDIDLLIVTEADLSDRTLPAGRLREPLDTIAAADAVLLDGVRPHFFEERKSSLMPHGDLHSSKKWGLTPFELLRRTLPAKLLGSDETIEPTAGPVLVVAGIAHPERVAASAKEAGWTVADALYFDDHHPYARAEVDAIVARARAAGARALLTTAKDAVRLAPHEPIALPVIVLPLEVAIEPDGEFDAWLRGRLAEARLRSPSRFDAAEARP
ncbi:MAG: tetraacyldisaccharide 4'-kinase [Vicinamibacterales bacterium]